MRLVLQKQRLDSNGELLVEFLAKNQCWMGVSVMTQLLDLVLLF